MWVHGQRHRQCAAAAVEGTTTCIVRRRESSASPCAKDQNSSSSASALRAVCVQLAAVQYTQSGKGRPRLLLLLCVRVPGRSLYSHIPSLAFLFFLVHSFRHSVVLRLLLRPALHFRVPTTSSSSIQPLSDGSTIHNSSFFNCQQCSFSVRVLSLLLLPLPPSNEECLVSNANVRRSERKKESIESDGQWKCSQIDRKVLDGHRLG